MYTPRYILARLFGCILTFKFNLKLPVHSTMKGHEAVRFKLPPYFTTTRSQDPMKVSSWYAGMVIIGLVSSLWVARNVVNFLIACKKKRV